MKTSQLRGINIANPVAVEKEYLLYAVDYAAERKLNHIQINGPIHDSIRGNIDGMTRYRKYAVFNSEKDADYVDLCLDAVNAACRRAAEKGLKVYMWHHELEIPVGFGKLYPEVLNEYGDIEVSHPLIQDFLENKIQDFFYSYPEMSGIVLTLHETKVPLLKLKNQKLSKTERVKLVTKILFDACTALGKELIVRPFASIEEDYGMMMQAYEEISTSLSVMDKWTQFDWSLTLPSNAFFEKIKNNPLTVEADIFGEFFGKGRLPLMLKEHLREKFAYCEAFSPIGYVARIDRDGYNAFGDVNEVNTDIFCAYLHGSDPDTAIDNFFKKKYRNVRAEITALMEETEGILTNTIYAKGYYFSQQSLFPTLNHCKNHFYFEMMRDAPDIKSDEWFIPRNWERGSIEELIAEKRSAAERASGLYDALCRLEGRMESGDFIALKVKFLNLKLVTEIWYTLTLVLRDGSRFDDEALEAGLLKLSELEKAGRELLGEQFYCAAGEIEAFCRELRLSYPLEKAAKESFEGRDELTDYVICGGISEGHRLKKEVNFSDTLIRNNALCRIPGNQRGAEWSSIRAHGWFSYELAVIPYANAIIKITMEGVDSELSVKVTIGEDEYTVSDHGNTRKEYCFRYCERRGADHVSVRFDKISGNTPFVYTITAEKCYETKHE